jgi:hypothetical protein
MKLEQTIAMLVSRSDAGQKKLTHYCAPKQSDQRQEKPWSNFFNDNGGRKLENNICSEEHKSDNRIAKVDQF